MHSKVFVSVLVCVTVICFTRVLTDDDHNSELADKLNMLVHHSGWRFMDNIKIIKYKIQTKEITDPMPVILEAISSGRKPIDESNVLERYTEIWTVLRCKYAEVIYKCRVLIQYYIRVCRNLNPTTDDFLQRYYNCFNSLLTRLESMSLRFKCMSDALEFMYSLGPQLKPKQDVMVAAQKMNEFTLAIASRTLSTFSEHGVNQMVVDIEIKTINDFFMGEYYKFIYQFVAKYCFVSSDDEWTTQKIMDEFLYQHFNKLIPEETTNLKYAEDVTDCYVEGIFSGCFYDLGFAYDEAGNVTIRNI